MKILHHIFHILVFLLVLSVILLVLSPVFVPKANTKEDGVLLYQASSAYGEPENTIDVLFLGNSEAQFNIYPMLLWRETGIPSHVCATGYQQLYTCLDFLKAVSEKQQLKVVFLETNAIYDFSTVSDSIVHQLENIFPILRYHNRWPLLTLRDFEAPSYTSTSVTKGAILSKRQIPAESGDYIMETEARMPYHRIQKMYVKQMADYCQRRGTAFVLISAPYTAWQMSQHNAMTDLAQELNVPFLDLNMPFIDVGIDWQTDTRDAGVHLNWLGAAKVTHYLGDWLSRYDLPDRRKDARWQHWNAYSEEYDSYLASLLDEEHVK